VETPNQEEAQARFAGEDEEGEEKEIKGKEKKRNGTKKIHICDRSIILNETKKLRVRV